jgi:exodeoxyribonuclease VII small subunit
MDSTDPSELSFEDAFRHLEEAVIQLEGGGLSIDDLVSRYETGMSLVALCRARLDTAEARLTRLVRDIDDVVEELADLPEDGGTS